MKLGGEGFIAYETESDGFVNRQHFPALSINPVDVSGAGDSLLAVMATALCTERKFMDAAALGCCMAAIAVENMGNKPIFSAQLKNSLNKFL